MKIAICGSISFWEDIIKDAKILESLGFEEVFIPEGFGGQEKEKKEALTKEEDGDRKISHDLIRRHHNLILKSDCIYVANYEKKGIKGYIGGNTFLEMGFAFVTGKPIFLLNPLPIEIPYFAELKGMKPKILNGELKEIKKYYQLSQ